MCTVSFISLKDEFIITSNRDELVTRPNSNRPKEKIINNCRVIYPEDPKAGGTWFAINEHGIAAVLLNGAFKKHLPVGNYSKSRGLVLLDIITSLTPSFYLQKINLKAIEPFTVILFEHCKLLEFRWDGHLKHQKELSVKKNYIWSSSTLYPENVIKVRENIFNAFVSGMNKLNEESILNFHTNNLDDFENGFIINRNNLHKTFSVTQSVFSRNIITMKHFDLLNDSKYVVSIYRNLNLSN